MNHGSQVLHHLHVWTFPIFESTVSSNLSPVPLVQGLTCPRFSMKYCDKYCVIIRIHDEKWITRYSRWIDEYNCYANGSWMRMRKGRIGSGLAWWGSFRVSTSASVVVWGKWTLGQVTMNRIYVLRKLLYVYLNNRICGWGPRNYEWKLLYLSKNWLLDEENLFLFLTFTIN